MYGCRLDGGMDYAFRTPRGVRSSSTKVPKVGSWSCARATSLDYSERLQQSKSEGYSVQVFVFVQRLTNQLTR